MCCPDCVENDGQCSLKGDPLLLHTFDGHSLKFTGKCNYVLARDCKGKTFSVHILNEATQENVIDMRNITSQLAVTVKIDLIKVRIGPGNKIRIGKREVILPYVKLGILSVIYDGKQVVVRANRGIFNRQIFFFVYNLYRNMFRH